MTWICNKKNKIKNKGNQLIVLKKLSFAQHLKLADTHKPCSNFHFISCKRSMN